MPQPSLDFLQETGPWHCHLADHLDRMADRLVRLVRLVRLDQLADQTQADQSLAWGRR